MPIQSVNELARTFENELGGTPRAVRTWVVTLTNDTLANNPSTIFEVLSHPSIALSGGWDNQHPDIANPAVINRKISVTERFGDSPYHVQVVAEYGAHRASELLSPTSRDAEWSFESQPSEVPALYYWDGNTRRPLVNSANDFYEGLTTLEQLVRATIRKNYSDFDAENGPRDLISATNKINSGLFLGSNAHTWKVAGVSTSYVSELTGNVEHQYWATTSEIQFRQSGWNLQLPDVGWNFLAGGQKRRAMVFDFENAEWVASPSPVALNGSGGQSSGFPAILERRVYEEANFPELFGSPPTV